MELDPAVAPTPFVVAVDRAPEGESQVCVVEFADFVADVEGTEVGVELVAEFEAVGEVFVEGLGPNPLTQEICFGEALAQAFSAGVDGDAGGCFLLSAKHKVLILSSAPIIVELFGSTESIQIPFSLKKQTVSNDLSERSE